MSRLRHGIRCGFSRRLRCDGSSAVGAGPRPEPLSVPDHRVGLPSSFHQHWPSDSLVLGITVRARGNRRQYRYFKIWYKVTYEYFGAAVSAIHERPTHFRQRSAFRPTNDPAPDRRNNPEPILWENRPSGAKWKTLPKEEHVSNIRIHRDGDLSFGSV
jgi:hypothetical protein